MTERQEQIEYVVGIDPDCKKSGFAFYKAGRLVALRNYDFAEYAEKLQVVFKENGITPDNCILVIEDGNMIKTIYAEHRDSRPNVYAEKARNVGRVQEMATCMIILAEYFGYTVYQEKPQKGNWAPADMTAQFKAATGWKKQSNPETRSAAFFGFLGLSYVKQ